MQYTLTRSQVHRHAAHLLHLLDLHEAVAETEQLVPAQAVPAQDALVHVAGGEEQLGAARAGRANPVG